MAQAQRTMDAALAKAGVGNSALFTPYLRAAITYWRLKEDLSRAAGDVEAELDAVARRITLEDDFRSVAGRSFHTVKDAITYEEVLELPNQCDQA